MRTDEEPIAYKWLKPNYRGVYGHGDYTDYLPKGARPGKWLPKVANPKLCERGYHIVKIADLCFHWGSVGSVLFEVETRGIVVPDTDKSACESIRLRKQVGVLTKDVLISFAVECAEHVLPIFEAESPDDDRPRKAIEAARSQNADAARAAGYAAGYAAFQLTYGNAADAASASAGYAADAASASAAAAARASDAGYAYAPADAAFAGYAAAAAGYASAAAGYAADAASASAAEREWQGKRLLELIS